MKAGQTNDASNPGVAPVLWANFMSAKHSTSSERDEFYRSWIALQCTLIPGVSLGVLVLSKKIDESSFSPVAIWPEQVKGSERLSEIIERVIEERCGLITRLPAMSDFDKALSRFGVAYPVLEGDVLHGVVAVEVTGADEDQLQSVMGQLHWGISWLELQVRRQRANEDQVIHERLKASIDQLARVLSEPHFESAAMAFITEMAAYLKCDRVSLGFVERGRAKVLAVSHSAQFGKKMNLIRAIGSAMDEAIDQRMEILLPSLEEDQILIIREHEALVKDYDSKHIMTLPLYGKTGYYGAITLERSDDTAFSVDEVNLCRSVAALAGAALEEKRKNDRLLITKTADAFLVQLKRLVGANYTGRKLFLIGMVALASFLGIARGEYRISADSVLEGALQRVLVAPYNGYIKDAFYRSGDIVKKGDVLTALDDRDLRLERIKYISQRNQLKRQYQEALAEHDRARSNIVTTQIAQVVAELDLIESQMQRASIKAPFEGLIISGDLSKRLGGSVELGEVLFEMTPLHSYRLILKVDERRINDVRVGQEGVLVLSSLPDEKFTFIIEKITPVTEADEGLNYFRVEAGLHQNTERIRPGMEGVGKIYVDDRKLIAIWTRELTEWVQLTFWSLTP